MNNQLKITASGEFDHEVVLNALEDIRKIKSSAKLSPAAEIEEVRIYFPLGGLPSNLSAYRDLQGCINAKSLKLMMENKRIGKIECLANNGEWLTHKETEFDEVLND